ncbi:MAG: 2-oxo acid dehydrogenase subunit E2 [Fimbriimonadaceae bacterium]|nr:2-oxo acid dehydrogenase subunit E2 [Fimbriimonadaceae bacterium]QYK54740.1 MAG: 2-oxo acid dehydrogenase subunit E2 [Fimbriimonadaceae bacterium]
MTEVIMPKMGDGMEEGTLIEWLKKDGEDVRSGEIIGTIQTDKATLELESPGSGKLTGFLIGAGDTVPVGRPIAAILAGEERLPSGWGSGESKAPAPAEAPASLPKAERPSNGATEHQPAPSAERQGSDRIKASPLAKRIASEAGIDLGTVTGTGPGGRIVEADVRAAQAAGPATSSAPVRAKSAGPAPADRKVSLNKIRALTAKRTVESKREAPHFYVTVEVDVDRLMALREFFKAEESGAVSVNDFVVAACARALRDMPEVNASFGGDHVLEHGHVNIGLAVALDDGLTLPVLRDADQMTLREIAVASKDLSKRARENKLSLEELSGATFSISNMGMLNVDSFSAIIVGPNAAILAISTARKKPVVVDEEDDEIEVRWRMNVTCSFDHRVVDGAVGAKFVNTVRRYLESPTRLLQ